MQMLHALCLLLLPRPGAPQDLPLQKQLTPGAKPPPPAQQPRPQDMNMPITRDAATSEFYLRTTNAAAYGLPPFPLPAGSANPPVGYQTSPLGPTTGQFTPLQSTGPHDPTGALYGQGPDFTLDQGAQAMYPIYQEDVPVRENVTFGGVVALGQPSTDNPIAPFLAPTCDYAAAYACSSALSACLGGLVSPSPTPALGPLGLPSVVDVNARQGLCACYGTHGACWAAAGCRDVLPQSDVDYCRYTLVCPLGSCTGSGAGSSALAMAALLLAAALSAALALGG